MQAAGRVRAEGQEAQGTDVLVPEASDDFVVTPEVDAVAQRALVYLRAGYAVHFCGPAGTGKTTLAFHVAAQLQRPVTLIHGDDEFAGSDLIGRDNGYQRSRVVDNYIRTVLKTDEEMKTLWQDNRLTLACRNGDTLIYDEFTRSRAEANNALLMILSERILNLPRMRARGGGYLNVHPEFRAIFTSNPEEYAGVHKTQDALMDRLINIRLSHYDRSTEVAIVKAKSGLPDHDVEMLVDLVREFRSLGISNRSPSVRAAITLGQVLAQEGGRVEADSALFQGVVRDVLGAYTAKVTRQGESVMLEKVDECVRKVFDTVRRKGRGRTNGQGLVSDQAQVTE